MLSENSLLAVTLIQDKMLMDKKLLIEYISWAYLVQFCEMIIRTEPTIITDSFWYCLAFGGLIS